ncbi:MAG: TrmH family RNA methyltransferase [Actinomycetota bacterium]
MVPTDKREAFSVRLTSIHGAQVKAVRRLHTRSGRDEVGRFLVEGPQGIREALAGHSRWGQVRAIYLTVNGASRHPDLFALAEACHVPVVGVTESVMKALSSTVTPAGLLAVCDGLMRSLQDVVIPVQAGKPVRLVMAHQLQDPGNVGTITRVAHASGARGFIMTGEGVDFHNPKCIRATAGSAFHLPIAGVASLIEAIKACQEQGLTVLAADGKGGHSLADLLDEVEFSRRPASALLAGSVVWIFGNEAHGLPADIGRFVNATVRVPLHEGAESLNVATAAAVCLYASARAHEVARRQETVAFLPAGTVSSCNASLLGGSDVDDVG